MKAILVIQIGVRFFFLIFKEVYDCLEFMAQFVLHLMITIMELTVLWSEIPSWPKRTYKLCSQRP